MIESIKITSLTDIGSNLSFTSVFPVVDLSGTPTTDKANLQIIGNYILSQAGGANFVQAAQATLAQSVSNAAQPNITSVGTLTSLAVTGNANLNVLNISVANLRIPGGTNGYVLQTDGAGNLTWTAQTGNGGGGNSTPGGANTQVQFNDAGTFGAEAGFTYNKDTNTLTVANLSVTANASMDYLTLTHDVNANIVYGNYLYGDGSNISNVNAVSAGVANSVAAANVVGLGNIATLSLNGNGSTILYGNGVFAGPNFAGVTFANGNVTANYFNGVATNVSVQAVNNNYSYHMAFVTGDGDTSLHMDADDNLQYNPQDGLMTVTRADMQYLSVTNSVLSNLVPFDSLPLTLGNANNRWQDLYLSNSTIYLGNATISANGNSVVIDSLTVGGNVGTIGNIASINLDGSSSNVLYGNGVFAPAAGGGNPFNQDLNTTDNVQFANITSTDAIRFSNSGNIVGALGYAPTFISIESYGSNTVQITANDVHTWTFGSDGVLAWPTNNLFIDGSSNAFGSTTALMQAGPNVPLAIITDGANSSLDTIWVEDMDDFANSNVAAFYINPAANPGSIRAITGNNATSVNIWDFNNDGHLTFPGNARIAADTSAFEVQNANAINFEANSVVNIYTDTSNSAYQWQFGDDGNLTLPGGGSIYSNPFTPSGAPGNTITLQPAGSGVITDQRLLIYPTAGDGDHIHMVTGNLYQTELFMGSDSYYVKLANTGNIVIHPYDNNSLDCTYTFGYDGNFNLPGNLTINGLTSVFGSNTALVQPNDDVPLVLLASNSNSSVSSVWVENSSDVANSNISAIYTPFASTGAVRIVNGNNASTMNIWDFGRDGNLTLPGNTFAVNYANGTQVSLGGGSYGDSNVVTLLSSFGSNTISTTGNVTAGNLIGSLANGNSNVSIATANGNVTIAAAGNTTMTVTGTGANVAGTLNATGNVTAQGTGSNLIRRAFGLVAADTNVTLDGFSAQVTSGTNQLSISWTGGYQITGWTETYTGGSAAVQNWVNLSSPFAFASGAMNSQGNGCRAIFSDQTPSATVYQVTVVRSGTSGNQWNISIERLV